MHTLDASIVYIICSSFYHLPDNKTNEVHKGIYWCVAYLPSEASIIEH
jgi:hypothetical protein